MICTQCHTLNPDRNRVCLGCKAPLVLPLRHTSARKPKQKIIRENPIAFRKPAYFTLRLKLFFTFPVLMFVFTVLSLIFFAMVAGSFFPTFKLWLLFYGLMISIPFLVLFYFLPFVQGDWFLARHFRTKNNQQFVVQVAFKPRYYQGIERWLDDADDVGLACFENEKLIFQGDSTNFTIRKQDIESISLKKIEVRSFFVTAQAAHFSLKHPISGIKAFSISPRMGLTIFQYGKINQDFCQIIQGMYF